jgi:lipopolysaccharide export system permease protein
MKLLRNYILKGFISPMFMALGVLTFVMLLGNLIKIAELVITKGVDILNVVKLFLFMTPYLFTFTIPISTLTAVLMCFGRLSSDNEVIAIRASGVNLFKLLAPILTIGIILSLFLVICNDRLIPYAHFATRRTLMEVGIKNPAAALEPGVFINSFQKYVVFIYHIEENKLTNIRIYEPQEGRPTRTIIAKHGEFISDAEKRTVKLKLIDGTSDEPDPNEPGKYYKVNFKTNFITLNLADAQKRENLEKKPKDMTIKELREEVTRLKKAGIDPLPLETEIYEKISLAFSSIVFILIGAPLAVITRRREKSVNFGIAVLVVGVFYLMFIGAEALSHQGLIAPSAAMWIPHIILGGIGVLLTYRLCAY